MSDNGPKALIAKPAFDLRQTDSGAEKVLSRIVSDALTIARGRNVADTSVCIRIGKYEFREQDYRQILIWAQEAGKTPEDLVSFLAGNYYNEEDSFLVDDGAIKHLTFTLPQRILQISHLQNLTKLWCSTGTLTKLEFVCKTPLEKLYCEGNSLTNLDLSNVPALTVLSCYRNQLTELDLSNAPALTSLNCWRNPLTALNLSNVPALNWLDCSNNHLTELDLSIKPQLRELNCSLNQLAELDLSNVPALTSLRCHRNQLTELDVRENRSLTRLQCDPRVRIIKHEWQSFSRA